MEMIHILGIGWREDDLTLGAVKLFHSGKKIILRTGRCECAEWLNKENIAFDTLDMLYEECEDFDELIERSADAVLEIAQSEEVVYCVNDLSDKTAAYICEAASENVIVSAGVSEGSNLLPYAGEDLRIISAADADTFVPDVRTAVLIRELDNMMLASDIKLKLTDHYPDELEIFICDAQGHISRIEMCDLDRLEEYDHRMCALIPAVRDLSSLNRYDVRHLEEIMFRLRDFDGCPWDREQTHESLRSYMIEEAYEAVDAIDREDIDDLYEELGDVLFQVIFHSEIARQYGEFELSDVTTAICQKMIRRHPHVFGDMAVQQVDEVSDLWNEIKKQEKDQETTAATLRAVAKSMPALMRAAKIFKRARKNQTLMNRFDLDVTYAYTQWENTHTSEAFGKLLMALSKEAEMNQFDLEMLLNREIDQFIRWFEDAENKLR